MLFLYHPDTEHIGDQTYYAKGWKAVAACGAGELPRIVTKYMNMPTIMGDGIRRRERFLFADWLTLDFDKECISLQEAIYVFKSHIHVIGTTKNHQKQKGKNPPADRFRVFLKFVERVRKWQDYEESLQRLGNTYGADPRAFCASQPFHPLTEIISVNACGKLVDIVKYIPPPPTPPKPKPVRETDDKKMPDYVQDWLTNGVTDRRNDTCFKIGSILTACGWNEDEILQKVLASPIPLDSSPDRVKEVRDAVRNGVLRSKKK